MQQGLLEVSKSRLRKKGPLLLMFPFRALRLKPLFLEEWGKEELGPFVAKQPQLCRPVLRSRLQLLRLRDKVNVAMRGEASHFNISGSVF